MTTAAPQWSPLLFFFYVAIIPDGRAGSAPRRAPSIGGKSPMPWGDILPYLDANVNKIIAIICLCG
jgi:hypothetical protein